MSRFDKYEPRVGGFRAPLAAAITGTPAGQAVDGVYGETGDIGKVFCVSIHTTGRVVRTGIAALTAIVGVICPVRPMAAGEMIDVMTSGEIVDFLETGGAAAGTGVPIYGHTDGVVNDTSTSGALLGFTVEASRFIVRVARPSVDAIA